MLYGERQFNKEEWQKKVKAQIKKIKVNELDDHETEFIELETIFNLYID